METVGRACRWIAAIVFSAWAVGCSVGPTTLRSNRADYNRALQQSANEQLLMNLVRLKYREPIMFLEVSSISASHSFAVNASTSTSMPEHGNKVFSVGGGASYADIPNVTYSPLQGQQYANRVLTEMDMNTFTRLYHSGWNVSLLMQLLVERIGGLQNVAAVPGTPEGDDYARFVRLATLWRKLQKRGDLTFRMTPGETVLLATGIPAEEVKAPGIIAADKDGYQYVRSDDGRFELRKAGPPSLTVEAVYEDEAQADEVARALGIRPARTRRDDGRIIERFRLVRHTDPNTGPSAGLPSVPIRLRSFLDVMFYTAQGVEVPAGHVEKGVVKAYKTDDGRPQSPREVLKSVLDVRCSSTPPFGDFVSVQYRGHWFYIDDTSVDTKDSFALLGIVFSIQSGEVAANQPILTIPVVR